MHVAEDLRFGSSGIATEQHINLSACLVCHAASSAVATSAGARVVSGQMLVKGTLRAAKELTEHAFLHVV